METYLGHIWDVYGTYLGCIWDISGAYLGQFWDLYGTYLGHILYIDHILDVTDFFSGFVELFW